MYLLNAFSIGMLPVGVTKVTFADVTVEQARAMLQQKGFESAVGHADTAAVMGTLLGVDVPAARVSVAIPARAYGVAPWQALVGQYSGARLPEGATALPEGAGIRWVAVYVD
jgi:hypothetical protein